MHYDDYNFYYYYFYCYCYYNYYTYYYCSWLLITFYFYYIFYYYYHWYYYYNYSYYYYNYWYYYDYIYYYYFCYKDIFNWWFNFNIELIYCLIILFDDIRFIVILITYQRVNCYEGRREVTYIICYYNNNWVELILLFILFIIYNLMKLL